MAETLVGARCLSVSAQSPSSQKPIPDGRVSFEDAVSGFTQWLRQEGQSDSLLWLTADRITGRGREFWLFRPDEMTSPDSSRAFYEAARPTDSSIRIDRFSAWRGQTIAYVENFGGDGRHLSFGIPASKRVVHAIDSKWIWRFRRARCRLFGLSPFLSHASITPRSVA